MKLQYNLTQALNTSMNVSPQFVQAVHILQLPTLDLITYLQEQCSENPFMEVVFDPGADQWNRTSSRTFNNQTDIYDPTEFVKNHEETIEEMLISQLRVQGLSGQRFRIAAYLAGSLNENGYLTVSLGEVSSHFQEPLNFVELALSDLQSLEPAGVGARNLQECLLIQIRKDDETTSSAYQIVSHYMNELASAKYGRIADSLQITVDEVKHALTYIRNLDPRPGLPYSYVRPKYVEPDAYIQKRNDGYMVLLNENSYPKISLNLYQEDLYKEAKSFVRNYTQSAKWIMRCLDQRKTTMYRVIEAIAQEQSLFLDKGIMYLKPLNLKAIAEKLELHESTISRAIANKYVQTPRGLYELKSFFSNGLMTDQGEAISVESIKSQIRHIIDAEDKAKPYSDQQITDKLINAGMQISRRTVMKYREEMHIVSSRLRTGDRK